MSQADWILGALRMGPVTPLDALNGCGCFRLAARIAELREQGHNIITEKVKDQKMGKTWARYHLITKGAANGRKSN